MLNVILWLPLAVGLICFLLPRNLAGPWSVLGSLVSLGLAIALIFDFTSASGALQHTVSEEWIPALGVRYELGVDGISLFMVLLTAIGWLAANLYSAFQRPDSPGNYFFMLGLAQTATFGAFLAQDLLLFVLFFDLMLIPFYILIGVWGTGDRIAATLKMIIYTLVGSLLMLIAAIATAVLSADALGQLTFNMEALASVPLALGEQQWIFWFFAAAFLVKMPAFLVHGWMADAYRACPLPVLALLSGVLSKVAAYGFLRVVLPTFPDATIQYQEVLMIIAVLSILYGSVMAFTQTNVRLIAGYSSIAQLGFITLGIFALRPDGADGSVIQMFNHGLVVLPLFFIIAVLWERFESEDLTEMGGMAKRAPILAVLFIVVTMATLAIPGSANFVGEFYILAGAFESKVALALIASTGIALAAFYSLRLFQRSMHNRLPDGAKSREITLPEAAVVAPLVGCIVALALYPALILDRGEASVEKVVGAVAFADCGEEALEALELGPGEGELESPIDCAERYGLLRTVETAGVEDAEADGLPPAPGSDDEAAAGPEGESFAVIFDAPTIDYAALSPVIALVGGLVLVLMAGLIGKRGNRHLSSFLTLATLGTAAGLMIWRLSEPAADIVSGALRVDGLALTAGLICVTAAALVVPLILRDEAAEESGYPETHALLLGSVLGMVLLAQAQNLISFFVALELLSIPLYILCGSHRTRISSLESGLKYLIVGSLGSATLLYGLAFVYGGSGATDFTAIAQGIGSELSDDPLVLIGVAFCAVGLAFKVSIAPFHQWTPDVYQGAPTPVTSFMAVATKAAAFAVFARFFIVALNPTIPDWQPALAAIAAISIIVGNVGALRQTSMKRMLGYSGVAQGGYMLVGLLVALEIGLNALVFYLAAYALMNIAAFTVILIRERETPFGDDIAALEGLGRDRPSLAWPMTIAMLALAGMPGTAGFMGKLYLVEASVAGDYIWLGLMIAVGTMISLGYYLRVIAAVWMRPAPKRMPAIAGASPEAAADGPAPGARVEIEAGKAFGGGPSGGRSIAVLGVVLLTAGATIFFGIWPDPLVDFAENAGEGIREQISQLFG